MFDKPKSSMRHLLFSISSAVVLLSREGRGGKACEKSDFYGKTAVADLCDAHFPDKKSENIWMIEFYAPWCGHCQALKPKFIEAAKKAKKNNSGIKFGAVDCTKEQSLCSKYGVKGYPTLKGFVAGKAKEYNGPRETDEMLEYLVSLKNARGTKGGSAKCSSPLAVDGVVPLCASHFPDSKKGKNNWVVVFHSSGDRPSDTDKNGIQSLGPKIDKSGTKLGVVDCSVSKDFCESKLSGPIKTPFVVKTYVKGGKPASEASLELESLSDVAAIVGFAAKQVGVKDEL